MKRFFASLGGVLLSVTLAAGVVVAGSSPAQAANVTDGFDPGNIISDANFYDGRAMEPGDVRSFLQERVPRCTIGDAGREPGSSWGDTKIADKCLRDFSMTTASRPANAYCKAYAGVQNEHAANIITKVGQACGISQKVLLIMLEKEQSLVTDTWPTVRQFDVAMGYACPDSGPGNSANCDAQYFGFFNQVYRAAWQLKVYRAHPDSYNYKPFQNNTVQYHPDRSRCGTSTFRIENWATAALYIYTPYRPNKAALDAGWGTGDSCSSYGNRNFYNFYKTWFGSTQGHAVASEVKDYYEAKGGPNRFGTPVRGAVRITGNGGGVIQDFENGRLTYSDSLKRTHGLTKGPFLTSYIANGGPAGAWGWIGGDAVCGLKGSGCTVQFQNGLGAYSPATDVRFLPSKVSEFWKTQGSENGALGYPIAAAQQKSGGAFQEFQGGSVIVSGLGDYRLGTELTSAYKNPGGGLNGLGFITKPSQRITPDRYFVEFERGNLYIDSKARSVRFGTGPFLDAFVKAGGPTGSWGWPLEAAKCGLADGGCTMRFEGGTAVYSKSTGVAFLTDAQLQAWRDRGAQSGDLGYPVGEAKHYQSSSIQEYQKAHLVLGPKATVRFGKGPFLDAYLKDGGPASAWGWPLEAAKCGLADGGCTMRFEGGTAVYSKSTGVAFLTDAQVKGWQDLGAQSGTLGYPVGDTQAFDDGSMQEYQKATLLIGPSATVRFGKGPFLDEFVKAGGPAGSWGWPMGTAECGLPDKGCRMEFTNGVADYTATEGVSFQS